MNNQATRKLGRWGFSNPKRRRGLLLSLAGTLLLVAGLGYWDHYSTEQKSAWLAQQGETVQQQLSATLNSIQRRLSATDWTRLPRTGSEAQALLSERVAGVADVQLLPRRLEQYDPEQGENGYSVLGAAFEARRSSPSQFQWLRARDEAPLTQAYEIPGQRGTAPDDIEAPGYAVVGISADALEEVLTTAGSRLGFAGLQQRIDGQFTTLLSGDRFVPVSAQGAHRLPLSGAAFDLAVPAGSRAGWLGRDNRYVLIALLAILIAVASVLQGGPKLNIDAARDWLRRKGSKGDSPVLEEALASAQTAGTLAAGETDESSAAEESGTADDKVTVDQITEPRLHDSSIAEEQDVQLDSSIFRAYDIRGVVGKTLDESIARQIGQAVGTLALERDAVPVVVARDGRLSGPDLSRALQEGIQSSGCDVVDIGAAPTPVLYFAAHDAGSGSGVAVTGSHNPPDYNGFKIMIGGDTLSGDEIKQRYRLIRDGELVSGDGRRESRDVLETYRQQVAENVQLSRDLKVVVDCGNGIAGVVAPDVLRDVGAEVFALFDEVDGTFPNHHPDPSEPENLEELKNAVKMLQADLGLAFDGDGDRLGIVTASGEMIYPDRAMILFARELLEREPGATIIYDVKCSGHLPEAIREAGGEPMMWKTGHSLVKAKMKETGAPLAGEMSGHFFFGEPWYGFDDAIYAAAKLLQILAAAPASPTDTLNGLPDSVSTPELKVQMQEGETFRFIQAFREQAEFVDGEVSHIDGVRVDWPYGWGLVRSSNTTPVLVLRFDADSEENLETIKEAFRRQMLAVDDSLDLPF